MDLFNELLSSCVKDPDVLKVAHLMKDDHKHLYEQLSLIMNDDSKLESFVDKLVSIECKIFTPITKFIKITNKYVKSVGMIIINVSRSTKNSSHCDLIKDSKNFFIENDYRLIIKKNFLEGIKEKTLHKYIKFSLSKVAEILKITPLDESDCTSELYEKALVRIINENAYFFGDVFPDNDVIEKIKDPSSFSLKYTISKIKNQDLPEFKVEKITFDNFSEYFWFLFNCIEKYKTKDLIDHLKNIDTIEDYTNIDEFFTSVMMNIVVTKINSVENVPTK